MDFRNEHNDDLIIDGNVRTQRAVASFLRADLLFIWKAAQQTARIQNTTNTQREDGLSWAGQRAEASVRNFGSV